ncbi:cytochrome c [Gallaecimonas kandeliae]|uniref:c-type cytochrome n=1 Tax=Gallaecimonas kandeliae TaxID=3029055 RepID=UPI00264A3C86|nr:cytochrome c [Gallaecimonas kandeliae]WKE65309.1 cytochrome c [Gallaecimonas kandeliae]
MKGGIRGLLLALVALLAACGDKPKAVTSQQTTTGLELLDQNWDDQDRQAAWTLSFGSRILPINWFLALEQAGSKRLFSANLARFGFASAGVSPRNPDGLPIGMTVTPEHQGRQWVGLGCSACHSGQVYHGGHTLHIDGGQSLLDFQGFEKALLKALEATLDDDARFQRFAKATGEAPAALRPALEARLEWLKARAALNATHFPYGRGRLDAFGQIFNAVTADFLGIPENRREPDAPVSYPVLWDAPHLDLVQWNASAPNAGPGPLVQNATTTLAVFGELNIHSPGQGYDSSMELENLGKIQDLWYQLKAPAWPEAVLGAIDRPLAEKGRALYQANCQSCHALADESDAKRELRAVPVPVEQLGTDPKMASNFVNASAKSGAFAGQKMLFLAGPTLGETAPSIELVLHAAVGALAHHPLEAMQQQLESLHKVDKTPLNQRPFDYKARPLSGIWASAPYLHNGSVPTLATLLSKTRPARFPVGKVEFDPKSVGLSSQVLDSRQVSFFDTSEPGNGNGGHDYGTSLSDADKAALLEYLKTL